jgi:hypothetical protein
MDFRETVMARQQNGDVILRPMLDPAQARVDRRSIPKPACCGSVGVPREVASMAEALRDPGVAAKLAPTMPKPTVAL